MRFRSLSGSLLIILYYNRTRNRSVNITVMPHAHNAERGVSSRACPQRGTRGFISRMRTMPNEVFRLMSNLQVTCVDDRVTCLQLMASVCGMCESHAGIRRKIFNMLEILRRTRRTATYTSVLQRALNIYKTYP